MNDWIKWSLVGALAFIIYTLMMYFYQRQLIYFPERRKPELESHADGLSVVSLKTQDGLHLESWYKAPAENKPTLLFLHGNAGNIASRMPLIRHFLSQGFGVLLLEYRGYGGNPGSPTEQGLYQDGQAGLDFLYQRHIKPENIVVYGESLGSGVATKLASDQKFCALILQSPFRSLVSLAHYHYPWVLLEPWDRFDSLSRMSKIKTPLLIVHGSQDDVVPYADGQALFKAANEPKQFITFPNKNHHNLWGASFYETVIRFIIQSCSYREAS